MEHANERDERFVRHLDSNAPFPHRLNVGGPLLDEGHVEPRAREILRLQRRHSPLCQQLRSSGFPYLRSLFVCADKSG